MVLSQSCFFKSLAVCKSLNFWYLIFGFYLENRTLRRNLSVSEPRFLSKDKG